MMMIRCYTEPKRRSMVFLKSKPCSLLRTASSYILPHPQPSWHYFKKSMETVVPFPFLYIYKTTCASQCPRMENRKKSDLCNIYPRNVETDFKDQNVETKRVIRGNAVMLLTLYRQQNYNIQLFSTNK